MTQRESMANSFRRIFNLRSKKKAKALEKLRRKLFLENLEGRQMMAAQINNLGLVYDSGTPGDLVSDDSRISLNVTGNFTGYVDLRYDIGNDGTIDATRRVTASGQSVVFDPQWNNAALRTATSTGGYAGAPPGSGGGTSFVVAVRADEYTSGGQLVAQGTTSVFNATLQRSYLPEISLSDYGGSGGALANGSTWNFGTVAPGAMVSKTLYIQNTGSGRLTLDAGSIALPTGFSFGSAMPSYLDAYGSAFVQVNFSSATGGTFGGALTLVNNDGDEYQTTIQLSASVVSQGPEIDVRDGNVSLASNASSLVFGNGTTSRTLTILNTGNSMLTINSGSIAVPTGYQIINYPASAVAPGGSTSLTVNLTATTAGTYNGDLVIGNNDSDEGTYRIGLSATLAPEIEIRDGATILVSGAGQVDFGSASVGANLYRTFTINNLGNATLTLGAITLPAGYSVYSLGSSTLAGGASTSLTLQVDTATAGTKSGNITIANGDADEGTFVIPVTATVNALPPEIALEVSGTPIADHTGSIDFGTTNAGTVKTIHVTIRNTGAGSLILDPNSVVLPSGYRLVGSLPTSVSPNSSVLVPIELTAATAGTFSGVFSFVNNDADEGLYDITLTGVVSPVAPQIALTQDGTAVTSGNSTVAFGNATLGQFVEKTFTLANQGNGPLTINVGSFQLPAGYTLASPPSGTVAAGGSTSMTVRFTPTSVGAASGTITFTTNDPAHSTFSFDVTGTGVAAPAEFDLFQGLQAIATGASVVFGQTMEGVPLRQTFTIFNSSNNPLLIDVANAVLPAGFRLSSNPAATVAAWSSTSFTLELIADAVGAFSGTFGLSSNDTDEAQFTLQLSGTVTAAPDIQVSDGSTIIPSGGTISLGTTQRGHAVLKTITVSNTGSGDLSLDPASITMPAGFTLISSVGSAVAAGATATTFVIRLDAATSGSYSGTFQINSSDPDESPYALTVTGEVVEPPPTVESLALTNDDGASATDRVTTDARLSGQLGTNSQFNGTVEIEFDHNGNGTVDGKVTLHVPGEAFQYNVREAEPALQFYGGPLDLHYRVVQKSSSGQVIHTGAWIAFPITLVVPPNPEIEVTDGQGVAVVSGSLLILPGTEVGTPVSKTFTITNSGVDPLTVDVASIVVPEGFTLTTAPAASVAAGASTTFTITAIATHGGIFQGTVSIPNNDRDEGGMHFKVAIQIDQAHLDVTKEDNSRIHGTGGLTFGDVVSGDTKTVQVTIRNRGLASMALGAPQWTGDHGGFAITTLPATNVAAVLGETTLAITFTASAVGPQSATLTFTTNDPDYPLVTLQVTGKSVAALAAAGGVRLPILELVRDTGFDRHDGVTSDPRVKGKLDGDLAGGTALVEFDHNGDGTVDGSVVVSDLATGFQYDARVTDPSFMVTEGVKTLHVRVTLRDGNGASVATSGWGAFGFEYAADPEVAGLSVSEFTLLFDTGNDSGDKVTVRSTIFARIDGPAETPPARIEFDHTGDGVADGWLEIDATRRYVTYDPTDSDPAYGATTGAKSLWFRLVTLNEDGTIDSAGGWQRFDFTLEAAPVSAWTLTDLKLQVDDGPSATDGESTQGAIQGKVTPPTGETLAIGRPHLEVDLDGDGIVDDLVNVEDNGTFEFDPQWTTLGAKTISLRVVSWSESFATSLRSNWTSLSSVIIRGAGRPIARLELNRDTGSSATDGKTYDATLRGMVEGVSEPILIEFDHNGDGTVDGSVWTDETGGFLYAPQGLAAGQHTLTARTSVVDPDNGATILGAWKSVSFETVPFPMPSLDSFTLAPSDTVAADVLSLGRALVGTVSAIPAELRVDVQIDLDNDGATDVTVPLDADGKFSHIPTNLPAGPLTLKARARVWDAYDGRYGYTAWTSLGVTVDVPPASPPDFVELMAQALAGNNAPPEYTGTVKGTVGGLINFKQSAGVMVDGKFMPISGYNAPRHAYAIVDFDWNNDGTTDQSITVRQSGAFSAAPPLGEGSHNFKMRTRGYDLVSHSMVEGSWKSAVFHKPAAPPNLVPTMSSLVVDPSVLVQQGSDWIVANPIVVATIGNDGAKNGLGVEFDYNNDGVSDAISIAPDNSGTVRHKIQALPYGQQTIRARVIEWNEELGNYQFSTWASCTFNHQVLTPQAAQILTLGVDTSADNRTHTAVGKIANDDELGGVTIELDANGDDLPERTAITNERGEFRISVDDLSSVAFTARFRTREVDLASGQIRYSAWYSYGMPAYASFVAPVSLAGTMSLAVDTGLNTTDGITSDPTVKGQVATSFSGALIEFDHNGDGTIDGTCAVGADGKFRYQPQGLADGTYALRARMKVVNAAGAAVTGAWGEIDFTLSASHADPTIDSFHLVADTGTNTSDGATSNAAVTGHVAHLNGAIRDLQIRIDGVLSDLTVSTDADGNFTITPTGLANGFHTITVRLADLPQYARGTTTAQADNLGWVSLSYLLTDDPDSAEAQQKVQDISELRQNWSTFSASIDNALASAELKASGSSTSASASFQDAIAQAASLREATINAAKKVYDDIVKAAEATRDNARAAALANFAASQVGNPLGTRVPTNFTPNVPATPTSSAPAKPATDPLPTTDPTIDDETDAALQSGYMYDPQYWQDVATADQAYDDAVRRAETTYSVAVALAQFNNALWNGLASLSLQSAITNAQKTYSQTMATAKATREKDDAKSHADFKKAKDKIWGEYNATAANVTTSDELLREQALLDPALKRDNAIRSAEYDRDKAIREHAKTYADTDAAATETQVKAIALARKNYANSLASNRESLDKAIAAASIARFKTVAKAAADRVEAIETAKKDAIYRLVGDDDSPWAVCLKEKADHRLTYFTTVVPKLKEAIDSQATAMTTAADASALARKTYSQSVNTAVYNRRVAIAAATKTRAITLNEKASDADIANLGQLRDHYNVVAAGAYHSGAIGSLQVTLRKAYIEAELERRAQIAAHQAAGNNLDYSTAAGRAAAREHAAAFEGILSAATGKGLTAVRDRRKAVVNQIEATAKAYNKTETAWQKAVADADHTFNSSAADAFATFQKKIADAHVTYVKAIVSAQATYTRSSATNAKTFANAKATASAKLAEDDAKSDNKLREAIAEMGLDPLLALYASLGTATADWQVEMILAEIEYHEQVRSALDHYAEEAANLEKELQTAFNNHTENMEKEYATAYEVSSKAEADAAKEYVYAQANAQATFDKAASLADRNYLRAAADKVEFVLNKINALWKNYARDYIDGHYTAADALRVIDLEVKQGLARYALFTDNGDNEYPESHYNVHLFDVLGIPMGNPLDPGYNWGLLHEKYVDRVNQNKTVDLRAFDERVHKAIDTFNDNILRTRWTTFADEVGDAVHNFIVGLNNRYVEWVTDLKTASDAYAESMKEATDGYSESELEAARQLSNDISSAWKTAVDDDARAQADNSVGMADALGDLQMSHMNAAGVRNNKRGDADDNLEIRTMQGHVDKLGGTSLPGASNLLHLHNQQSAQASLTNMVANQQANQTYRADMLDGELKGGQGVVDANLDQITALADAASEKVANETLAEDAKNQADAAANKVKAFAEAKAASVNGRDKSKHWTQYDVDVATANAAAENASSAAALALAKADRAAELKWVGHEIAHWTATAHLELMPYSFLLEWKGEGKNHTATVAEAKAEKDANDRIKGEIAEAKAAARAIKEDADENAQAANETAEASARVTRVRANLASDRSFHQAVAAAARDFEDAQAAAIAAFEEAFANAEIDYQNALNNAANAGIAKEYAGARQQVIQEHSAKAKYLAAIRGSEKDYAAALTDADNAFVSGGLNIAIVRADSLVSNNAGLADPRRNEAASLHSQLVYAGSRGPADVTAARSAVDRTIDRSLAENSLLKTYRLSTLDAMEDFEQATGAAEKAGGEAKANNAKEYNQSLTAAGTRLRKATSSAQEAYDGVSYAAMADREDAHIKAASDQTIDLRRAEKAGQSFAPANKTANTRRAQANLTEAQALAPADRAYTASVASEQRVFDETKAEAEFNRSVGNTVAKRIQATSVANAERDYQLAQSAAQRTYMIGATTADNAERTAETTANIALQTAEYTAQATAAGDFASRVPTTSANYQHFFATTKKDWYVTDGAAAATTLTSSLNAAATTRTNALDAAYADFATATANAQYSLSTGSAIAGEQRTIGKATADRAFARSVASADEAWQNKQADARTEGAVNNARVLRANAAEEAQPEDLMEGYTGVADNATAQLGHAQLQANSRQGEQRNQADAARNRAVANARNKRDVAVATSSAAADNSASSQQSTALVSLVSATVAYGNATLDASLTHQELVVAAVGAGNVSASDSWSTALENATTTDASLAPFLSRDRALADADAEFATNLAPATIAYMASTGQALRGEALTAGADMVQRTQEIVSAANAAQTTRGESTVQQTQNRGLPEGVAAAEAPNGNTPPTANNGAANPPPAKPATPIAPKNPTAVEKLESRLNSMLQPLSPEEKAALEQEIALVNGEAGANNLINNPYNDAQSTAMYGLGIARGFFLDGALGGIFSLVELGWTVISSVPGVVAWAQANPREALEAAGTAASWAARAISPTIAGMQDAATINAIMKDPATARLRVRLSKMSGDERKNMEQRLGLAARLVEAEFGGLLAKMTPHERGRFIGAVIWEIVAATASIGLGGELTPAWAASVAQKIRKINETVGDVSWVLQKLVGKAGLINKILGFSDDAARAAAKIPGNVPLGPGARYADDAPTSPPPKSGTDLRHLIVGGDVWATGGCFAAGTKLIARGIWGEGYREIERITTIDEVLSRDQHDANGPLVWKRVEELFERFGQILYLHIGGKEIATTPEHPFYVDGKGWTPAIELKPGDILHSHDGQRIAVDSIHNTGEFANVYNFRVAEYHTYFVGDDAWGFSVWAHNAYHIVKIDGLKNSFTIVDDNGNIIETVGSTIFQSPRAAEDFATKHGIDVLPYERGRSIPRPESTLPPPSVRVKQDPYHGHSPDAKLEDVVGQQPGGLAALERSGNIEGISVQELRNSTLRELKRKLSRKGWKQIQKAIDRTGDDLRGNS